MGAECNLCEEKDLMMKLVQSLITIKRRFGTYLIALNTQKPSYWLYDKWFSFSQPMQAMMVVKESMVIRRAVDEDLYKIPSELIHRKPKRVSADNFTSIGNLRELLFFIYNIGFVCGLLWSISVYLFLVFVCRRCLWLKFGRNGWCCAANQEDMEIDRYLNFIRVCVCFQTLNFRVSKIWTFIDDK